MSARLLGRVGLALTVPLLACALIWPNEESSGVGFLLVYCAFVLACSIVGALLLNRRPENPVGRLLAVIAVLESAALALQGYGYQDVVVQSGNMPLGDAAVAVAEGLFIFGITLFPLLFLLFPTGELPTPRWRPFWRLAVASAVTGGLVMLLDAAAADPVEGAVNPFAADALQGATGLALSVFFPVSLVILPISAISVFLRLRRAQGIERAQVKWFALAAGLFGFGLTISRVTPGFEGSALADVLLAAGFLGLPTAIGVAVLRYRLYDIDVVINRTVVYGALSLTLAGAYLASVLLLQLVLSPESDFAIAGSTLAVAALFRPARTRIQALVNRRFYRQKYDVQQTLEGFGGRLRDEVDLEALGGELRGVVRETMQPTHISLWIRTP